MSAGAGKSQAHARQGGTGFRTLCFSVGTSSPKFFPHRPQGGREGCTYNKTKPLHENLFQSPSAAGY